jgi:hypothetical protein
MPAAVIFQPNWLTPAYLLTFIIIGILLTLSLLDKLPGISTWTQFFDLFENKGAQLLLLWITDMIVLLLIVHYWGDWEQTLRLSITNLLSAVNGAFLGAVGAKQITGGNGGAPVPTSLKIDQISGGK